MSFYLLRNISCLLTRRFLNSKRTYTLATAIYQKTRFTNSCIPSLQKDQRYYYKYGHSGDDTTGRQFLALKAFLLGSTAFTFNWFKSGSEEQETPQDKLVTTIKRSLLCIQREQYDKAEQMLHLALRMAQDLQSREGVTYIYDVMANLAMEREQYKKAEKLFTDVMKRLLSDGFAEDSPQILHISAKLAAMAQLQGDLDKSMQGFKWTLSRIDNLLQQTPDDKDLQELFGLTKNWFGQLLMKLGQYDLAKKNFQEAFDTLVDVHGGANEEAITILNNLSVACVNLDDFSEARRFVKKALELVKDIKESSQEGILQANLGLIYLREGLVQEAKDACSLAYRLGKKNKNDDAVEQAEYCLSEVKAATL